MPCPAAKFLMGLEFSFETKDEICFAMDLMASDLGHLMIYRSSYCFEHASRWTMQIALGINALHDLGIIHRDIKAENIFIDIRGNARIGDFGLSYLDADARPLNRQGAYSTSVMGTLQCMAPDILLNISIPSYMKYGPPVDWWSLGCVIFQLVSPNHMVRFASSFAAILPIQSFQPLFETQQHILSYVAWCTSDGRTHRQHPSFQNLKSNFGDLISGLLDPSPSSRYGFREVSGHQLFLNPCGTSAFVDAYSCAVKRPEVPELLPDLRCGREPAKVLQRLAPGERRRFPNVDWVKPV
ncbi:kinase-like domain-containing protein [Suillus occidentalis]|nr:kinase-like domain-containing protein [Suillus occidentalis]